jgi:hypothetical protein
MFYEIRNYWYDPEYFQEYKKWSIEVAAPYFRSKLDVVGIWFKNDMPVEYAGSLPKDDNMIPANMTWIIRWNDKETRDKFWKDFVSSEDYKNMPSPPGGVKSYLREEIKFAEAI